MTKLSKRRFSTVFPRPRTLDANAAAEACRWPRRCWRRRPGFRPRSSLPTTTAPWPWYMTQLVIVTCSVGLATRRPSASRPDLITMQSSPVLKKQSDIRTLRLESTSIPSPFGPVETKVTPRIDTLSAEYGMKEPHRRLGQGDALDKHVLAPVELDEGGPQVQSAARANSEAAGLLALLYAVEEPVPGLDRRLHLGRAGRVRLPVAPPPVGALAVQGAAAGDRYVFPAVGIDEGGVGEGGRRAFPSVRHDRRVGRVSAVKELRARLQVECDVAFQDDGPRPDSAPAGKTTVPPCAAVHTAMARAMAAVSIVTPSGTAP